jgi:hypothetical protein
MVGVSAATVLIAGQAPTTARTPWGEPDLQGIWYAFEDVPLQRPAEVAGRALLTDEEYAKKLAVKPWIEQVAEGKASAESEDRVGRDRRAAPGTPEDVGGAYNAVFSPGLDHRKVSRRTSLITDPADGRIPPLTPEAQKRLAAFEEYQTALEKGTKKFEPPPNYSLERLDRLPLGPEDRSRAERCLGLTMPAFGGRIYHRIVQSPGYLVLYYEPSGHAGANRVIPIGDKHVPLPPRVRQWLGDSRGRWDGSTLVIETTNFSPKTEYQGARENLALTERLTRIDAQTVRYEVTVNDPTTFTKPWTFRADMEKRDDYENGLYEPACHEGNYGMIGILSGIRAAEKAFAEGRGPDPAIGGPR